MKFVTKHLMAGMTAALVVGALAMSVTLVASMIGFGLLGRLSRADLGAWNVSVVLNVLGAGLGRLAETLLAPRRGATASSPDDAASI